MRKQLFFNVQYIENIILRTYKYCVEHILISNGIAWLCYDGIMRPEDKYTPSMLQEFNKIVHNKFGLDLNIEENNTKLK